MTHTRAIIIGVKICYVRIMEAASFKLTVFMKPYLLFLLIPIAPHSNLKLSQQLYSTDFTL
jgi:hypothetical protein